MRLAGPWGLGCLLVGVLNPLSGLGLGGPGAIALAILLAAAYLWTTELVPLFVTALVVLALNLVWLVPAMSSGGGPGAPAEAFTSPFFSDLILLFLGGFVLAAAMSRYGLDARLAEAVIARAGRRLPSVILASMAATAFLSMWMSNTAATALMLGLALRLARGLGPAERKALLLSVPMAANVGGLGTPIGTPPNAIVLRYLAESGHPISFIGWLAVGLPAVAILLLFVWGLLVLPIGVRQAVLPVAGVEASAPILGEPRGRWLVTGVGLLTVAGWLFGGELGWSPGLVSLFPVTVFFGLRLLSIADFRHLPWDVLVLMGGGLCLAVTMERSGLAGWLVGLLPTELGSPWAVATILLVAACAMSTLMSNTATANLLAPIVAAGAGSALGAPPVFLALAFGCSLAMALPISTPPNAMAFGTGELAVSDLIRLGLATSAVGLLLTAALFVPWWRLLGHAT